MAYFSLTIPYNEPHADEFAALVNRPYRNHGIKIGERLVSTARIENVSGTIPHVMTESGIKTAAQGLRPGMGDIQGIDAASTQKQMTYGNLGPSNKQPYVSSSYTHKQW